MAKDSFGHGVDKGEININEDSIREMLDATKSIISQGEPIPEELARMLLQVDPADWAGGFLFGKGGEDFAEEIDAIQSYARGEFRQRPDTGRYQWDSLLLDEGQTPENFILENYPLTTDGQ